MLKLVADERHQGNLTSALDSDGQLSLVTSTGTGYAAGQNLGTLGHVTAQTSNVFVIDAFYVVYAEAADLAATLAASACTLSSSLVTRWLSA